MLISNDQLKTIVLESRLVDAKKLEDAAQEATKTNDSLADTLVAKDLISDENVAILIADALKLPFVHLSNIVIPEEVLSLIPEVVARKQKIIVFKLDKIGLHIAMANPKNVQLIGFLEKKVGLPVNPYLATERELGNSLIQYTKDVPAVFEEIIKQSISQTNNTVAAQESDAPIIKIVATIISFAYENKASDIHIEPLADHSLVRFRIDGILHDIVELPIEFHQQIVTRVKVLARLRTDEHQAAQDGKLQFKTDKEELDVRVSIAPITKDEKIVMRLLSSRSRQFSLTNLGFTPADLAKVEAAYRRPYGMILSTGPTGSGKTTTIYAILKLINRREINIMTIEDPIEYEIPGVNQIQVNPKTNLTFASGLRSILRQDPNVIFVGEIRDNDTAGIAINASLTGHLVLSTLHTNDAATALPRLLDMGIEPFLLASTVNIIIAQRLLRKICSSCRVSSEEKLASLPLTLSKDQVKRHFTKKRLIRLYRGKGCPICHQTGYLGRLGIFEVLEIHDDVRQAIATHQDASVIRKIAITGGMTSMFDDGIEKIKQGLTTIEELLRVTKE